MTNDAKLTLRDVIELYQLRWQIELFFKELKSTLGLHHYRFKEFEKAETWVTLCLVTFVYLEWIRVRKLKQKALKKKEREWWQTQRTYGLALAVRQGSRTTRTEATGGEDGDTHRAKGACQAAPAVTSQGVPRGDLIGKSKATRKQFSPRRCSDCNSSSGIAVKPSRPRSRKPVRLFFSAAMRARAIGRPSVPGSICLCMIIGGQYERRFASQHRLHGRHGSQAPSR